MRRIGVDFDNTIACYDSAFCEVAGILGIAGANAGSKVDVKRELLSRPDGDVEWQRLQGQVYGKYMRKAAMFPGFVEFLYLTRVRGEKLFVISHKSEYGHFDPERVPLRDEAIAWMREQGLVEGNGLGLSRDQVFFESTREEKVRRIADMGCTHFIDDLPEVFGERDFPADTLKILFAPAARGALFASEDVVAVSSWREAALQLHGAWTGEDVFKVARASFPELGIVRAELRKGNGNSRIYELAAESGASYALKIYPDRQTDPRPRLETEFAACRTLRSLGYAVPEAIAADERLGWALYSWISGGKVAADANFVDEAIAFLRRLRADSARYDAFDKFGLASEACLSGREIERQVRARLAKLEAVESESLQSFLRTDFTPCLAAVVDSAKSACGSLYEEELARALQIVSPSDFGAHNALRTREGTVFIDFEYLGWDDPVKLVCDFYFHPGMSLTPELREQWIRSALETFSEDRSFELRLRSYLGLYGLRWCLILLNEFLRHGAARRVHAEPAKAAELESIQRAQLEKSRKLCQQISKRHT